MSTPFEVQAQDISDLNDLNLTKLLKILLHLEASSEEIAQRGIGVALNIRAADGGEDGRVEWIDGPQSTDYFPCRLVQFQNKATEMGPQACADEIVGSNGDIKPLVDQALSRNGAYVLFTTQLLNLKQIQDRIDAIRATLTRLAKPYALTAHIDIYDAAKIQGWTNRYLSAVTAVLAWIGKPILHGLQTWGEWAQYEEYSAFNYIQDEKRGKESLEIRQRLSTPKNSSRIIGLSGLGKTRMALELCRDNLESDHFSKSVVYFDAFEQNPELVGHVRNWVRSGLRGVVVVDNCQLSLHKSLRKEIEHQSSNLSLLTLDFNPDTDNTNTVALSPVPSEIIKQMLEPIYGKAIADLARIVSFAQGFPLMAVLLAKARLDNAEKLGSLTDDDILKKMLWGNREPNEEQLKILRACSLFEQFGLDDSASAEYEFIATEIARLDRDSFCSCIYQFERRGVIDKRGRYRRVIPTPLAVRLASEWWSSTSKKTQTTLINTEFPGELTKSFCDQIAKLDFLPQVKELTAGLCGEQGPFGQAEVILSARGSNLFRALTEVNPDATAAALFRTIERMDVHQRLEIADTTRRNLVWALENLCFRSKVFEKSAKCLLWLAEAENEHWSNNATGQFVQLFRTFLSGTEAVPEQRLQIIDWALQSNSSTIELLGIQALEAAIDTHGHGRRVGPEYQGSGKPLVEWKPRIWQEAFDYWNAAIERLTAYAVLDNELGAKARDIIGSHIRSLVARSKDVMITLNESINGIVAARGKFWPIAVESIKNSLEFESNKLPPEAIQQLQAWLELLTPDALSDRLKLIVSVPPWEHKKDESGHYMDVAAANAEQFAVELSTNISQLEPHLPQLLVGEQRQASNFARTLIKTSQKWEPLMTSSIKKLVELDRPNVALVAGIMEGVYLLNPPAWELQLAQFAESGALNRYYILMATTGAVTIKHLDTALELLRSQRISAQDVAIFSYGRAIDRLEARVVTYFSRSLRSTSSDAAWVALDILYSYCHGNTERWDACGSELEALLENLELKDKKTSPINSLYQWQGTIERLLKRPNKELAAKLTSRILDGCKHELDFSDMHHYIKPAMRIIVRGYGVQIWRQIAVAVDTANPLEEYRLTQLFGAERNDSDNEHSTLSDFQDETLLEWCESFPNSALSFIARSTDVYVEEDGVYGLSPRVKILLDRFGDNEEVLSELSANMGTFGWTGSLVPMIDKEINALSSVRAHPKDKVRKWVDRRLTYLEKQRAKEIEQDEERDWGII